MSCEVTYDGKGNYHARCLHIDEWLWMHRDELDDLQLENIEASDEYL